MTNALAKLNLDAYLWPAENGDPYFALCKFCISSFMLEWCERTQKRRRIAEVRNQDEMDRSDWSGASEPTSASGAQLGQMLEEVVHQDCLEEPGQPTEEFAEQVELDSPEEILQEDAAGT